jgi:hypothetical protein
MLLSAEGASDWSPEWSEAELRGIDATNFFNP